MTNPLAWQQRATLGLLALFATANWGCAAAPTEKRAENRNPSLWATVNTTSQPPSTSVSAGGAWQNSGFDSSGSYFALASDNYVFVPSPASDSVVVIDSNSQSIRSVQTGANPSHLVTIPGSDAAVTLNTGSGDASLLRVDPTGNIAQTRLPLVTGANALVVAPSGRYAVAFFDSDQPLASNQIGDFQAVSLLNLSEGQESSYTLTTGFKPEEVLFPPADPSHAFVRTESELSVLALDDIDNSGLVPAHELPDDAIGATDIHITADGSYAIAPGSSSEIQFIDLLSGDRTSIFLWSVLGKPDPNLSDEAWADVQATYPATEELPASSTYQRYSIIKLAYDAGTNSLFALLNSQSFPDRAILCKVPLTDAIFDLSAIESEPLGIAANSLQVTTVGLVIAYYADLTSTEERLSVLDFAQPQDSGVRRRTVTLLKGVRDVVLSPDGETAIVLHSHKFKDPNYPGLPLEERIARSPGHSLLKLDTGESKLEQTKVDAQQALFSTAGTEAFVLFNTANPPYLDEPVKEVMLIDVQRFVTQQVILLDSPPLFGANVPGQPRFFVAQNHPDGRLSFIDWSTGEVRTVTGFELNSRIQN